MRYKATGNLNKIRTVFKGFIQDTPEVKRPQELLFWKYPEFHVSKFVKCRRPDETSNTILSLI